MLNLEFIDQVAEFIEKNTRNETLSSGATRAAGDPFTGGNRYTPSSNRSAIPNPVSENPRNAADFNPWTSGYTSNSGSAPTSTSEKLIPVTNYVLFKVINFNAIFKKLFELLSELKLSLEIPLTDATTLEEHQWTIATNILTNPSWPKDKMFPAFDLIRYHLISHNDQEKAQLVLELASAILASGESEVNAMLAFRAYANMFLLHENKITLISKLKEVLGQLNQYRSSPNKNMRQSVATVLLKCVVILNHLSLMLY
jgi:hypothetical protein